MKGLRSIVPLRKESMRGVEPRVRGTPPAIEWVKPTDIFVEESYQRDLEADGSTTLIRKIAGDFDWSRYKLPICCRLPEFDDALVAIDGQHTATAAACVAAARAGINLIPVAVISAAEVADRAKSFVGHKWKSIAMADAAKSGEEIGEALTGAWCRALDVRLAAATKKTTGPEPAKPPQKPVQKTPAAPERPPVPPIQPVPPMPPLSFEEPPVKVSRTVSSGGVSIDLETGTVAREKRAVRLPLDQAAFAAALLRVMPAQLPADRIAPKVWGGPTGSPRSRLKTLMDEANFGLAAVRLKIRAFDAFFAISDL